MPYLAKSCFIQGLRENVCKVIMSVDILELDLPSPNVIPDEVIPNLNMLRLEVLHRVERNLDGTFIVTPKRHFVTNDTVIL